MNDFLLSTFAWILAAAGCGVYWFADRVARNRRAREGGDRGDYWSMVTLATALGLGLPLLFSAWIEVLSAATWKAGLHLQFDRTGGWGLHGIAAYIAALVLPFAVWAVVLAAAATRAPRDPETGRWLAGVTDEPGTRRWVLGAALPCLAVMVAASSHLGGGPHAFPAAVWGFQAVVVLSLVGVARSAGATDREPGAESSDAEPSLLPLAPWPEVILRRGIEVTTVGHWRADDGRAAPPTSGPSDLRARLQEQGAGPLEPRLVEAVERLVDPTSVGDRERLIHAPDHAGQVEVVAAATALLAERFHEHSLVIVPRNADRLAVAFRRWLGPDLLFRVEAGRVLRDDAPVWIVDADTLSGWLLPEHLREPERLGAIGLVVWWDLHDYSGVLGANLWAVSRRLHRLLGRWGRPDVRTLALMRRVAHDDAEAARFVQSVLPHRFHQLTTYVERRFAHDLHVHLLSGGARAEDRGDVPGSRHHLLFQSARASAADGWPTHLDDLPGIPDSDVHALLQEEAGGGTLGEVLLDDPAAAAATLIQIDGGDVLSLPDRVARRGRRAPPHLPHHVGIESPENPYARHLLRRLGGGHGRGFSSSRRLVCAEGTSEILRRHLLLALEEMPDTCDGLSRAFRRETEIIRDTLDSLADEGQLQRTEVRFLDEVQDLRRDHLFKSRRAGSDDRRPLTTVGLRLLEVVDPAAGQDRRGVRMRVDPERLGIEAYPGRVFLAAGRRYRVKDWASIDEAMARGCIECEEADRHARTWRLRTPYLHELDPGTGDFVVLSAGASPLARLVATGRYEERLRGSLRLDPPVHGGATHEPRRSELRAAITTTFRTRALILRFQEPGEPSALPSLVQALRHVLPVHVGIGEDALEVVPLAGDPVRGRPIYGLAVVDLYPGGIGLVDALRSDEELLVHLLEHARDWLEACPCGKDDGCVDCLRNPAARAVSADLPPRRGPALELLREVLD